MKQLLLYLLILLNLFPNLTLSRSNNTNHTFLNNTNHTSLNVANDVEQNYTLLIVCIIIVLALLLLVLYEKFCVFWNRVDLLRTDTDTDTDTDTNIIDLR